MKFYPYERLRRLQILEIERKYIMPAHTTIYKSDLIALISSHEKSIEDARDDVNYYALLNDDKLVAYYEGRIVSLQISLNQLRNLYKSLFLK